MYDGTDDYNHSSGWYNFSSHGTYGLPYCIYRNFAFLIYMCRSYNWLVWCGHCVFKNIFWYKATYVYVHFFIFLWVLWVSSKNTSPKHMSAFRCADKATRGFIKHSISLDHTYNKQAMKLRLCSRDHFAKKNRSTLLRSRISSRQVNIRSGMKSVKLFFMVLFLRCLLH